MMKKLRFLTSAFIFIFSFNHSAAQNLTSSQEFPILTDQLNYGWLLNGSINGKLYYFNHPFQVRIGRMHEEIREPDDFLHSVEMAENHPTFIRIVNAATLKEEKVVDLGELLSKSNKTTKESIYVSNVIIRSKELIVVYTVGREEPVHTFYCQILDENGTPVGDPHTLLNLNIKKKSTLFWGFSTSKKVLRKQTGNYFNGVTALEKYRFELSPDKSSLVSFTTFRDTIGDPFMAHISLLNMGSMKVIEKTFVLEPGNSCFSLEDLAISNDKKLYLLFRRCKSISDIKEEKSRDSYFYSVTTVDLVSGAKISQVLKMNPEEFIQQSAISINDQNEVLLTGSFGTKSDVKNIKTLTSLFSTKLSSNGTLIEPNKFQLNGAKYENLYRNEWKKTIFKSEPGSVPKKIVHLKDGSWYVIGQTAGVVKEGTSSSYSIYYYCLDITISRINKEGKIEWVNTLPVSQRFRAPMFGYTIINNMFGFTCTVDEKNNISVFYSNSLKNYVADQPKQTDLKDLEFDNTCKSCDGISFSTISSSGVILKNKFIPWPSGSSLRLLSRRGMATISSKHYLLGFEIKQKNLQNENNYIVLSLED